MDDSMAKKIVACFKAADTLRVFIAGGESPVDAEDHEAANEAVDALDGIDVSLLDEHDAEVVRCGRIALVEARDGVFINRDQWPHVAESLDVLAS